MLIRCGSALAERAQFGLEVLSNALLSQPAASRVMNKLPAADGLTLLTQRDHCVVKGCKGELVIANHSATQQMTEPTVYTKTGVVRARLLQKRCTSCTALHYFSYAAGGTLLEGSSIQAARQHCCCASWWLPLASALSDDDDDDDDEPR